MTRLFLCRHAEVEERYHRVFGGRIDMGLSPKGRTQAQSLAAWLLRHRFDAVYASPMQRVQLTLDPFRPQFQGTPILLDGLREVDFGGWTGCGWDEVQERFYAISAQRKIQHPAVLAILEAVRSGAA
jgi:broad specificity phosphatase PhoE